MNQFLEHYLSNKITPVKQDISNLEQHFDRRTSLYKILGLPPTSFKNKRVLEVGPGGGYNPLVTQSFNLKQYDLVEPNQYAIEDINSIFTKYNVDSKKIKIYHSMLEDFKSDEKYDIIICEGMIPGLDNKQDVLNILDNLLNTGGIMIVTSADELSYLFEILRHYIAYNLVKEKDTFDKKLDIFEKAFATHLNTLEGMSRFKRDCCADNLMGTMHFNYDFSFKECIEFLGDKYTFYKSSPNLFTDYRWYKEVPTDTMKFNKYFTEQFEKNRHNLLHYKAEYSERTIAKNNELVMLCKKLFLFIQDSVVDKKNTNDNIVSILNDIGNNIKDLNNENTILYDSLNEIKQLIENNEFDIKIVSDKYQKFQSAFGRGTSYFSLIKESD